MENKLHFKRKLTTLVVILLVASPFSIVGQDLFLAADAVVGVAAGEVLHASSNLTITSGGVLRVSSDASNSGSLMVSGSVTGDITYQRNFDILEEWHITSAPVTTASINTVATSGPNGIRTNVSNEYSIGTYDNTLAAGSRWSYYSTTTAPGAGNFVSGLGYSMSRDAAGIISFSGEVQTSDVVIAINTSSGTHYWTPVGNPYPFFLPANNNANVNNVLADNIAVLDASFQALYFFDATSASYQAINHASDATYIHPGQGFMVRAQDATEDFTFTESRGSHQTTGVNTYYRTTNTTPSIDVSLSNGSKTASTQIKFFSNATTGLDPGFDAGAFGDGRDPFSLNTHLVTESQGINFMLQCLPDNNYEDMTIPLSVNASANTTLTFSIDMRSIPSGVNVYIEDTVANTINKINTDTYEVSISEDISSIGRFYLRTSSSVLSIEDDINNPSLSGISMYKTDNTTLRIAGIETEGKAQLSMYSILGQEVLKTSFNAQRVQDIQLPKSLKTGVYIVQLAIGEGVIDKKIIIE